MSNAGPIFAANEDNAPYDHAHVPYGDAVAEKTALVVLCAGRSLVEAAEASGLSMHSVCELWTLWCAA